MNLHFLPDRRHIRRVPHTDQNLESDSSDIHDDTVRKNLCDLSAKK